MRLRAHLFAVAAGAALFGLAACDGQDAVAPQAAPAPSASVAAGPAPKTGTSPIVSTAGNGGSARTAGTSGCPVSATTLQRAAHLSDGWRIKASSIRCAKGWATAEPLAPTAAQQGDGVILFKYTAATHTWKKKAEGSSLDCAALGVPAGATATLGACAHSAPSDDGCPVSATTLQRAAHLSDGWRIKASSIRCAKGWATAEPLAPTAAQQGDGVILFKYTAATHTWKKKAEGSSIDCATYGLCSHQD
ncbi:hypothetical protein [Actinoplanes sp. NPDC049681]|uniref:hypothetical protein n=1 Tax=Actinoplanes sp. NPDC049681 TaxID=3363905 RepID=UPI00378C1BFB